MNCLEIKLKPTLLIFITLPIWTTAYANSTSKDLDMTDKVKNNLMEIWCGGTNYTALCEGSPEVKTCLGEMMQDEMWRKINDTSLHDYEKEKIGLLVITAECIKEATTQPEQQTSSAIQNFLMFLIFLVCSTTSSVLGYIGYRYIRKSISFDEYENDADGNNNV